MCKHCSRGVSEPGFPALGVTQLGLGLATACLGANLGLTELYMCRFPHLGMELD